MLKVPLPVQQLFITTMRRVTQVQQQDASIGKQCWRSSVVSGTQTYVKTLHNPYPTQ
jgi:hypothetical protein